MSVDLDRLRASLLREQKAGHFVQEDGALDQPLTPAAVLFPIVLRDDGHTVLLTQRTAHLRDHAGQISFPGGRVEAHDQTPIETALRETEEEIGLSRERVEIVGFLPEYRTGTGFRVTPVVALVRPPFDLRPDPFEVAEIFEVPLAFLIDPANHQQHSLHYRGALRHYFAMPYGDYFIWGATAGMIRSLSERLGLLQVP
ncbi:MAG: CoA pyrophosphatase [Dechloromonas sp.]|nr:CoA pyrophosphatase [Dechloromonas sp.]